MYIRIRQGIIASLVLFAGSSLAAAHDVVDGNGEGNINSRFKIFTAEHEAVTKGGKSVKIQSIFKIDLETGTVWRYRQGVDQKGKPYEEFFEVPNQ
ncbi:hypothetical protein [Kaarinaea lacus]